MALPAQMPGESCIVELEIPSDVCGSSPPEAVLVGLVSAERALPSRGTFAEDDAEAWLMRLSDGAVLGCGAKSPLELAGAVPTGCRFGLRHDADTDKLQFLVDGAPHGAPLGGLAASSQFKLVVSFGPRSDGADSAVRLLAE